MNNKRYNFKAKIYKVGINCCVDVPTEITSKLTVSKGFIKIKGTINGFAFKKKLVPVKKKPYRLFVNIAMLKGGQTEVGQTTNFSIAQDFEIIKKDYPVPPALTKSLKEKKLLANFHKLSDAKRKEILKYLNSIKTEATLQKNIDKLVTQLKNKDKNVRVP